MATVGDLLARLRDQTWDLQEVRSRASTSGDDTVVEGWAGLAARAERVLVVLETDRPR